MTEGQYKVSDDLLDELNKLDNEIVQLIESGDETKFRDVLGAFVESDLIVPPDDLTLSEAARIFSGEGLIPD